MRAWLRGWVAGTVCAGVAAALASCATAPKALEQPWVRVEAPGLEIWSALPADRTVEIARELALFQDVVRTVTTVAEAPARVRTRLLVLDRETRDLFGEGFGGFFDEGLGDNVMVVRPVSARSHADVVRHEYAHHLTFNEQTASYPVWFVEGWAQLLSTIRVEGDEVHIGAPPAYDQYLLRRAKIWLPFTQVIAARRQPALWRHTSLFYAQSWALVHFLQMGREDRLDFRAQLEDYVGAMEAGQESVAAFERAFGWESEALAERLRRYTSGAELVPVLRVPRERFAPPVEAVAERAEPAEVASEIGWVYLRLELPRRARWYFDAALSLGPETLRALTGLAAASAQEGRWEAAQAAGERALALAPADALVQLTVANALHERAARADRDERARAGWLREARAHYRESQRLAPDLPEAHVRYGETYLLAGEPVEEGLAALERGHRLLAANGQARLALARAYARLGRTDDARRVLAPVSAFAHARSKEYDEATALLAELDGDPRARAE